MESKVFILDQTSIKKLLTIYKLIIPDFQRNFVWKKSKKEQLLASLFRGFPIGAITLYKGEDFYYIIDGLQRINTLNQYLSRPQSIISFDSFYQKAEKDISLFLEQKGLTDISALMKKNIKIWYESLNNLYEYEKVSVLYRVLGNGKDVIAKTFAELDLAEELLEILKAKIEIVHDDIALIIYSGSKENLPELFRNINTGSVALSQYEILQSVWNDYLLKQSYISETYEAFGRELELIQNDYEISAVKEAGTFDIFKNMIGLNHMICCRKDCDIIFRFSGFKKLSEPKDFGNGIVKYYSNDSIAFEIYSAILCNVPNKIVKAADLIYKNHTCDDVSRFINEMNHIIMKAVDIAVQELKRRKDTLLESKYHSFYILAGIIFSEYDIDAECLSVHRTGFHKKIYDTCMDIEKHKKNKWFVDENRQVGFFSIKMEELLGMKKDSTRKLLKIKIEDKVVSANTVKEFYKKIFEYLMSIRDLSDSIPYATGRTRYLISRTNQHINGNPFVSPIKVGDYYIETHKSKSGAVNDIYKYMKIIGIDVSYTD